MAREDSALGDRLEVRLRKGDKLRLTKAYKAENKKRPPETRWRSLAAWVRHKLGLAA